MEEDYYENGSGKANGSRDNAKNNQSPADSPFADGSIERTESRKGNIQDGSENNISFILFLILILLLLGNTDSFTTHFQLIDGEVNKIKKLLEAVSVTNENLQNAVRAPQKVMQSLNGFKN